MSSVDVFGVPNLTIQIQNITGQLEPLESLYYRFRLSFVDLKNKEVLDCHEFKIRYSTYIKDKSLAATMDEHIQMFISSLIDELGINAKEENES